MDYVEVRCWLSDDGEHRIRLLQGSDGSYTLIQESMDYDPWGDSWTMDKDSPNSHFADLEIAYREIYGRYSWTRSSSE